jgi:hypothetical protein
MNVEYQSRAGCITGGVGAVAVMLLAPFAYVVRAYRGWRRDSDIRIKRQTATLGGTDATIDLHVDVPIAMAGELRARLTDVVIRVAEALRSPDDVYHQVYRQRGLDETMVLPVGPLLQELGDRLSLALGHGPLAGRTVVWLTLPRGVAPAELVDPYDYDPEAEGEPHAVMMQSDVRWGFATSFAHTGPSVVYRVLLFVPAGKVHNVEALVGRLER